MTCYLKTALLATCVQADNNFWTAPVETVHTGVRGCPAAPGDETHGHDFPIIPVFRRDKRRDGKPKYKRKWEQRRLISVFQKKTKQQAATESIMMSTKVV